VTLDLSTFPPGDIPFNTSSAYVPPPGNAFFSSSFSTLDFFFLLVPLPCCGGVGGGLPLPIITFWKDVFIHRCWLFTNCTSSGEPCCPLTRCPPGTPVTAFQAAAMFPSCAVFCALLTPRLLDERVVAESLVPCRQVVPVDGFFPCFVQ